MVGCVTVCCYGSMGSFLRIDHGNASRINFFVRGSRLLQINVHTFLIITFCGTEIPVSDTFDPSGP